MNSLQPVITRANTLLLKHEIFKSLQSKGISPLAIVSVTYVLYSISIFYSYGAYFTTLLCGFLYPFYQVLIHQQDWNHYFMVLLTLQFLEPMLIWIPFYHVFKSGLIVALMIKKDEWMAIIKPWLHVLGSAKQE